MVIERVKKKSYIENNTTGQEESKRQKLNLSNQYKSHRSFMIRNEYVPSGMMLVGLS